MAIVVATVTIEPRICGTTTLRNSWRSVAPSSRAASRTSADTPLIAADRTTMANPVWSQTRIMISAKTLIGLVVNQGIGLTAERDHDGVQEPDLRRAGGLPGVHEAPDDRRADERDRERQEHEGLGQRLAPDPIEQPGDQEAQQHAAAGADDQPQGVVAQDREELRVGQHREVGERELALVVLEARAGSCPPPGRRGRRPGAASAGPTKTHGRMRSRHFGWSRLTSAPTPRYSSQMPPTPTASAITASRILATTWSPEPLRRSVAPAVLPRAS